MALVADSLRNSPNRFGRLEKWHGHSGSFPRFEKHYDILLLVRSVCVPPLAISQRDFPPSLSLWGPNENSIRRKREGEGEEGVTHD